MVDLLAHVSDLGGEDRPIEAECRDPTTLAVALARAKRLARALQYRATARHRADARRTKAKEYSQCVPRSQRSS